MVSLLFLPEGVNSKHEVCCALSQKQMMSKTILAGLSGQTKKKLCSLLLVKKKAVSLSLGHCRQVSVALASLQVKGQ